MILILFFLDLSKELNDEVSLFNREIASKFTDLSLLSHSSMRDLSQVIVELNQFLKSFLSQKAMKQTAFFLYGYISFIYFILIILYNKYLR